MSTEEISCKSLWESLSDYIDGELSDELCRKLETHMAGCEHCRVVFDTTTKTIRLYQDNSQATQVPADVHGRLVEILHLEDYLKPKSA